MLRLPRRKAPAADAVADQERSVTNAVDGLLLDTRAIADLIPHRVLAEIRTGLEPEGVVVDARGRRAFVACARSDAVSVVDLARSVVVSEIAVGREPIDIAFD